MPYGYALTLTSSICITTSSLEQAIPAFIRMLEGRSLREVRRKDRPLNADGAELAVLISNGASDRLRRLSVNADECAPHVLRVTEADRLRDAFDRFGRRFYATSGYIGAEPFHHTRGRGAGLRPECATELASAHPGCFRQMFEGKRLGDVIAGVADGGGNTIVLRCQIGRGREL